MTWYTITTEELSDEERYAVQSALRGIDIQFTVDEVDE
jgi:hypothetical protein